MPLYGHSGGAAARDFNSPNDCGTSPGASRCPGVSRDRYGTVTARLLFVTSAAGAGRQVPLYFQPTLGGSDINGNDVMGTLTIAGNYFQSSGATYTAEISPNPFNSAAAPNPLIGQGDVNVNRDVAGLGMRVREMARQCTRRRANVECEPGVIVAGGVPRGDRGGLVLHVLEVELEVAAQGG